MTTNIKSTTNTKWKNIKGIFIKNNPTRVYTIPLLILTLIFFSSCVPSNNRNDSGYKLVLENEQEYEKAPLYNPKNKNTFNGKNVVTSSNINKNSQIVTTKIETYSDLSKKIRNDLSLNHKKITSGVSKNNSKSDANPKNTANSKAYVIQVVTNNDKNKRNILKKTEIIENEKQKYITSRKLTDNDKDNVLDILSVPTKNSKNKDKVLDILSTPNQNNRNTPKDKVFNILSNVDAEANNLANRKKTIALLLPLSGKYAKIGNNLLNSAEMAIFDLKNPNIILKTYNTQASATEAKKAFKQAQTDNVSIILGPVFSRTTRAIIPLAQKTTIPVLSYSNDITLAGKGIYLLGFNPLEQIRKIVEYAHSQNIKYFASIAPENDYGILITKVLSDYLYKNNLPPANMQWYLKADESLSKSLKILTKQTEKQKPLSVALLIPEGGKTLSSISKRLFNANLKNSQFRLLGSGAWDSSRTIKDNNLVGSWFATSPSKKRKLFRKKFINNFSYTPIKIASIAYDSVIASNQILSKNDNISASEELSKKLNSESFSGINGQFKFNSNGTAKRLLSIIEITENGFSIAKPAENNFNE